MMMTTMKTTIHPAARMTTRMTARLTARMTTRLTTRRTAQLTALLAALLAAGCAQLPQPGAPLPAAPALWQGEADGATDAVAADAALLADPALDALLAQADAANRDLAQAALRIRQATQQLQSTELRLSPSASLSSGLSRPLDPPGGLPRRNSQSWSASLGVGYELDLWGRLAAQTSGQAAQLRAAQADAAAARLLLRNRVIEAYWQLAAAREQDALAQQQLALNRELLAATRLRVREGKLLPIEVDRAAATLQQAEVRLADLRADKLLARLQLALLLDQPPPGPQPLAPRLPSSEPPTRWRAGAGPAAVLERRPDVQRARAQVDAALARLHGAEAERYPRLSFSASLGSGGERASDWLANPLATLAANLAVPLIDWRRLDLQRDAARTELELAALALREVVALALVEVETALLEGERLRQQLDANATRLREAQETERLAALRLEAGAIARADFLQARNARLEAEQGRLQLRLRAWLNRAQLIRAVAGGGLMAGRPPAL
jgi:NodT family efflux transporter outer membrane factor (OMF) lipoprotein